jgi:hypothetical protein
MVNAGNTFAVPIQLSFSGLPKNNTPPPKSPYDNFVRNNLATSQEIIRMACESIGSVLEARLRPL